MLDEFLISNRDAIIAFAEAQVEAATGAKPTEIERTNGIPVFIDQIGDALRIAKFSKVNAREQIKASAGRHGHDLLMMGLSIGQVVRDYGSVSHAIAALAIQKHGAITPDEFQTLNLCLDDAISEAVTAYSRQHERAIKDEGTIRERRISDDGAQREVSITAEGTQRLGVLAHEMRNLLHIAMLSFETIKSGRITVTGSTGEVLTRSLLGLRDLIDRSLADVRLEAGIDRNESIPVAAFVQELEIGAAMQARALGVHLVVDAVEPALVIEGDRQILAAALSNLLQNAFKFSSKGGHVSLTTRATADRILINVQDTCGGLPPGTAEGLFAPFQQRGTDRTGIGLGLSICRRAATAMGGEIRVRDLPGEGCVFTLDLPRGSQPPSRVADAATANADAGVRSAASVRMQAAGDPKAQAASGH